MTFLIPPFAVLWGYLFLGEIVESGLILGALLVCVPVAAYLAAGRALGAVPLAGDFAATVAAHAHFAMAAGVAAGVVAAT